MTYKSQFPVLAQNINGHPLVYLDTAASAQKPQSVSEAIHNFYTQEYGTVHRGVYTLSQNATIKYDKVREKLSTFINTASSKEIIYTKNTTEAINIVAAGLTKSLSPGDEILVPEIEHHANFVPWQHYAKERNLTLKTIPIHDSGELDLDQFESLLNKNTKIVALAHVSNVLGTIHPIKEITKKAHALGAKVVIDGAQAAPHLKLDMQDLNCDFYAFSSHKLYGPTGVGILYGKAEALESLPPFQFGGDMIESVTKEKTTYAPIPEKFEAGTPPIAEVIGLGAAIDFIQEIGIETIEAHENTLKVLATDALEQIKGLRIIGTAKEKAAVISFTLENVHPHDIGTILDQEGVSIRAGHHCSQPTMARYGLTATARASFAIYNDKSDIDALVNALQKAKEIMS